MTTNENLSALALTQLRLDVEEACRKAGTTTGCPTDYLFFDPLEEMETRLDDSMDKLNFANEFVQMREAAANRFPLSEWDEHGPSEERFSRMDGHGIKGLFAQSTLWAEAARVSEAELERFSAAVGLAQGDPIRELHEKLGQRLRQGVESLGFSDFRYWATLAVCSSMDQVQFDQFVRIAGSMSLLYAKDLASHLHAEPLDARIRRKVQSGARPTTQATPMSDDQASELTRLRQENERLRVERDILKKSIAIFAETPT